MRLGTNRILKNMGVLDFDSDADVIEQARHIIENSGESVSTLTSCLRAFMLNTNGTDNRCNLASCVVCNHQARKNIIVSVTRSVYGKALFGIHCTIVDNRYRTPQEQLANFNWRAAFAKIRNATTFAARNGNDEFIAVGSLEFVLCDLPFGQTPSLSAAEKKAARYWQPHIELELLCKNPLKSASLLRNILALPAERHQTPMKNTPSYCLARHLAYVTKLKFERRAPGYDSNGRSKPKWRPLSRKNTAELIEHLSGHLQTDRVQIWGHGKTYDKLIKKIRNSPNNQRRLTW
jgi:hypothetical protein